MKVGNLENLINSLLQYVRPSLKPLLGLLPSLFGRLQLDSHLTDLKGESSSYPLAESCHPSLHLLLRAQQLFSSLARCERWPFVTFLSLPEANLLLPTSVCPEMIKEEQLLTPRLSSFFPPTPSLCLYATLLSKIRRPWELYFPDVM